jgi:hypothetical protein
VWLWARNASLCDGPGQSGPDFNTSLTEGQIQLASGVQCSVGRAQITNGAIAKLQQLTRDRDTAFTALYQRTVESSLAPVSTQRVLAAEQAVVASRFNGSRSAYLGALARAHADAAIARGVLGDELRRSDLAAVLPASNPSTAEVKTFYSSYPDVLVRAVETKKPSALLYGKKSGLILEATAPVQLFSGGARTIWTPLGRIKVTPLGTATPLGTVPLEQARPAIVAALRSFDRGEAFERWTEKRQQDALATTVCLRDELPQASAVELSTYLPFLQL